MAWKAANESSDGRTHGLPNGSDGSSDNCANKHAVYCGANQRTLTDAHECTKQAS